MLTRTAKLFMFVFMAGALVEGSLLVSAQTSGDAAGTGVHPVIDNPVAQVRQARSWGIRPVRQRRHRNRQSLRLPLLLPRLSGGQAHRPPASCRRPERPVRAWRQHHAALAGLYPGPPTSRLSFMRARPTHNPWAAAPIPASASRRSSSAGTFSRAPGVFSPGFRGPAALIYTPHKFPPDVLVPHGTPGATSVWNFSPQGGGGFHYFIHDRRSIDVGVNAIHISSASLGDHNPGVNASVQFQVGYTFWK